MNGVYVSSRMAVEFMLSHPNRHIVATSGHWCLFEKWGE